MIIIGETVANIKKNYVAKLAKGFDNYHNFESDYIILIYTTAFYFIFRKFPNP